MTIQPRTDNRKQLLATAAELQTMADLLEKYPAEAQLIMAALEDGLELGPMRVSEPMTTASAGASRVITVSGCAGGGAACRVDDCAKPADLVIAMTDDADDAPRRLWCLDHWAMLGDLIAADGVTCFDRQALELISARLGADGGIAGARHAVRPR
jgi:hypothetical protein